jgi:hypothetical protein
MLGALSALAVLLLSPARAEYDARVQGWLDLAARTSPAADTRQTQETLRKCAPGITLGPGGSNFGTSDCPMSGPDKGCYVILAPSSESGEPYSDEAVAGTLIHELQHVRRACEGGGANRFTDERDAWDMQYRFYTRVQQTHGGAVRLDSVRAQRLSDWQLDPDGFYAGIVKSYAAMGYILPGEVTVAEQRRAARERFQGWQLEDALAKLEVDQALSEKAWAYGQGWRSAQEAALAAFPGAEESCRRRPWACIPKLDLPQPAD